MRALQMRHATTRFGLARIASPVSSAAATRVGPLELRSVDDPPSPGEGWQRVRTRLAGICGSDLSLVSGHASAYFEHWVTFPFVPGHEVVGELDDGTRIVLEPVLGHAARGLQPPFPGATPGDGDDYAHLVAGSIDPGIQTGFCCATGGGWGPWFWAHDSQIHPIEDSMCDERAVLVEPFAGGIHAALLAAPALASRSDPLVAVVGAGTMGLATIAGLRRYVPGVRIVVGARYDHQRDLARRYGADVTVADGELKRAIRREVGCHVIGDQLSGGADVTIDAVGSTSSIVEAMAMTRPRGQVVLLGMPAEVTLDLTGLWHRETSLKGAYTYGTETLSDGTRVPTFDLAMDTVTDLGAESLVSATYAIDDHVDAIAHAATAGRRGAVKIAFDLRESS